MAQQEAEHTARAREYCRGIGLEKRANESSDEYIERLREHLMKTQLGRLVVRGEKGKAA